MSHLDQQPNPLTISTSATHTAVSDAPIPWMDGASPAITQLRGQIRRVAPYFRTALVIGEPDCGEIAVARILHQFSPLNERSFVDLSAVPHNATPQSEEALASVGMFFLSDPGTLSQPLQTILLRLLRRHGANAPRIVACAARSLRPLVSANGFSSELADHLGSLRLVVPPLRERREDIPQLLAHILEYLAAQSGARIPELAPDLIDAARLLPWRGNLAQLYSVAEGLLDRATHLILHAPDLDAVLGAISPAASQHHREVRMIRLDDVIQEHIRAVLYACNGNKLRTAEVLGISRSTLYRMLEIPAHHHAPSAAASQMQMTC